MHGPDRSARGDRAARLILATRAVDRAYRLFDRLRSEAVLALASDRVLDRFNAIAYGSAEDYQVRSPSYRRYLFPWEEDVVARFFPRPPARVLVGGAGAGREVFALAAMGYEVVAFEPSPGLARAMLERAGPADRTGPDPRVRVFRAAYEDLPALAPVEPGARPASLDGLGPFDASVIGWGSFSHLRRSSDRAATLQAFGGVTEGPVVASFLQFAERSGSRPGRGGGRRRVRDAVRRRAGREPGDSFSIFIGFYHVLDEDEVRALARTAGLEVVHLSTDSRDTNWPHAVFRRPTDAPGVSGGGGI